MNLPVTTCVDAETAELASFSLYLVRLRSREEFEGCLSNPCRLQAHHQQNSVMLSDILPLAREEDKFHPFGQHINHSLPI